MPHFMGRSCLFCRFGLIESLLKMSIIMTLEMFGKMINGVKCNRETGGMLRFFRLFPWALSRFKGFLAGLYHCSPTGGALRGFFMPEMQVCVCAVYFYSKYCH